MKKLIEKYQEPKHKLHLANADRINPLYYDNFSTVQGIPIEEILEADEKSNRIKVRYKDSNGKTVEEYIRPASNFWVDNTNKVQYGSDANGNYHINPDKPNEKIYDGAFNQVQTGKEFHIGGSAGGFGGFKMDTRDPLANMLTPWGIVGTIMNEGLGRGMQYLPENWQEILAKGRYLAPSYWIDRVSGLTDEQIMNGKGNLFGTGTGTSFDFMSAPLIAKGVRNTPYVAAAQKFNKPLQNWGRSKIVSRMIDEGIQDRYGSTVPLWRTLFSRTSSKEVNDPYSAVFEKYSNTPPPRSTMFHGYNGNYVRPQIRTDIELGAREPFMSNTQPMPGIVERANTYFPKFNFRLASIPEQSKYIIEDQNSFITHPMLVRYIEGNPEIQRIVEQYASREKEIPLYTYPNGKQIPIIESTTGENVSLGAALAGEEAGIQTPHLQTLVGINPIEGVGGEIGKGGITDFRTRNGYNFSTNNRWNANQYSWFGRANETAQRLKEYGIGEKSPLYQYYMNIHKIIDDLHKHYNVKNYFYKNPDVTPIYRGTEKPVNFSLQTHLVKQPNGKIVMWNPIDQAIYQQATDILSQFWGDQVYGGGIKELLIPRQRGFKIGSKSLKPLDYKDLAGYQYVIDPKHQGRLPLSVKNMDTLEEWSRDNRFKSFWIENINDPVSSNSYADTKYIFAKKTGGKLLNNT